MPTSLDNHKFNLKSLVSPKMTVLDLGLKDGVSAREFLEAGCIVDSVDLIKSIDLKNKNWFFHQGDVSKIIRELLSDGERFDLVYCDITYYDGLGLKYGTREANRQEIFKLREDMPIYWQLVKDGGRIVINDYVNSCGKREAPRIVFNEFVCQMNRPFTVYPTRGGMAVLWK